MQKVRCRRPFMLKDGPDIIRCQCLVHPEATGDLGYDPNGPPGVRQWRFSPAGVVLGILGNPSRAHASGGSMSRN